MSSKGYPKHPVEKPEGSQPPISEYKSLVPVMPCVGCGTKDNTKTLAIRTSYGQGANSGVQIIPICELCSIDLAIALGAIWNNGQSGN